MADRTDIAIAGGGLNGSTLAIALADAGFRVALIEPVSRKIRRNAAFDGRAYALSRASQSVLSAIGLWEKLRDKAQPILDIQITDGRVGEAAPSPFQLDFSHSEIEEGPMGYLLEDRHLRRALLDRIAASDRIEALTGRSVEAQTADPGGIEIGLSDATSLRAALLIGCDGHDSATARRAGIGRQGWKYSQSALVCAVSHTIPHHGTARQHFLPSGPVAMLPLTGERSSIVWTERTGLAQEIQGLSDADYTAALRPRLNGVLGDISLTGARYAYPLSLSLADALVAERVALVGDAAHVVHPIAGQGLNAGLKDVAALAEVLVEASRRGEDIGRSDVLERYQQWRRFDIWTLAVATDGFNRLFSNDGAILRGLRDLGLGIVNRFPMVRRGFIREAAGLTGDLPRLSRGQPL